MVEIVQENHYYPLGMQQNGNWAKTQTVKNDYLYNGKELNTEIGLNWSDYGARFYDSAVGRFTGVDPLAERLPSWSTYNYTLNNPIKYIDPDGRFPWIAIPIIIGLNLASKPAVAPTPNTTSDEINDAHNKYHKELLGAVVVPLAIDNLRHEIMDQQIVEEKKNVPNPDGKKGGKTHQDKNIEVVNAIEKRGNEARAEEKVMTPNGEKSKRFADQAEVNPKTGDIIKYHQVGKQNKNGTPVKRERTAAKDIENATGVPVEFHPYNTTDQP